jgi:hypothetical protein
VANELGPRPGRTGGSEAASRPARGLPCSSWLMYLPGEGRRPGGSAGG